MKTDRTHTLCALLLSMISYGSLWAQNTFQKLYTVGYDRDQWTTTTAIQSTNPNNYLVLSEAIDNTANQSYLEIHRVDQNGNIVWTNQITSDVGNEGWGTIEAQNGDYIISGFTNENRNPPTYFDDFTMTRLSPTGAVVWSNRYAFAGRRERCFGVVEDLGSGDLFMGGYANTSNGGGTGFSDDIAIVKTNSAGVVQWANEYGGANSDRGSYMFMGFNPNEVVTSGNTFTWGSGNSDAMMLAANTNTGAFLWGKYYGGPGFEEMYIIPTTTGTYMTTGWTTSWGAGQSDIWVNHLDPNGNLLWSRTYGTPANEYSFEMVETPDGFAICGYTDAGPHGNTDILVIFIDVLGNVLWSHAYGGDLDDFAWAIDLCTDDEGLVVSSDVSSYHFRESSSHLMKVGFNGITCNCDNIDYPLDITIPPVVEDDFNPTTQSYTPTVQTMTVTNVPSKSRTLCTGDFSGASLRPASDEGTVVEQHHVLQSPLSSTLEDQEVSFAYEAGVQPTEPAEARTFEVRPTERQDQFDVFMDLSTTSRKTMVKVTDMNGVLLLSERVRQNPVRVNLDELPSGIYIVTMEDRGKVIGSTKVSVIH